MDQNDFIQKQFDLLYSMLNKIDGKLEIIADKIHTAKEDLQSHESRIENLENYYGSCKAACKIEIEGLKKKVEDLDKRTVLFSLIKENQKISLIIIIALAFFGFVLSILIQQNYIEFVKLVVSWFK